MSGQATGTLCIGALLVLLTSAAAGQTVYRCGPAANQYSQQPCADGKAVDVSDPRTPAQAAEARAAVRDQYRMATAMARERRAEEAAHKPAMAGGISLYSPKAPAVKKPKEKRNKRTSASRKAAPRDAASDSWSDSVAVAPASGKKKKKKAQV